MKKSRNLFIIAGILFFIAAAGFFFSDRNGTGTIFLALGVIFLGLSAGKGPRKGGPENH